MPTQTETKRLILRQWKRSDFEPFAAMSNDPRVMEFFPKMLTRQESDNLIGIFQNRIEKQGFGFWALELKTTGEFIGFTGLSKPIFKTHFTPCVEIGWRLAFEHWGKGYATEAALESLRYGFEELALAEIVAFTAVNNVRSRHVMEKLHMTYNPKDDFNHPSLPDDHPLRAHVLYRLKQEDYFSSSLTKVPSPRRQDRYRYQF